MLFGLNKKINGSAWHVAEHVVGMGALLALKIRVFAFIIYRVLPVCGWDPEVLSQPLPPKVLTD